MLKHNTQPADILAFAIKLLKIHIGSHTCTHQPLPVSQKTFSSFDRFLTTKGKHTNYYQTLTYHIVQKCCIF